MSKATVLDAWGVLSIISALLSATAIVGAGFALFRRRMVTALAFAGLALPTQFVMEASRCDAASSCGAIGWAALPSSVSNWEVRVRPVTEANEARAIASATLSKSGSDDSPYKAKRFDDHWIISTINQQGWPGARAIKIDTRTAETSLVDCPAKLIQCGMERPISSDGRRQFRNDQLGLAAAFPLSWLVCTSRGEDEKARGFFAMVRPADLACDVLDQSRQMGVEIARSRKLGCASVEAPSLPWRSLSPETAKLFKKGAPILGGRPSIACELRMGGQIQVSVYVAATSHANRANAPSPVYEAFIVTTPAYLADDIGSFEAFLNNVSIGRFPSA